MRRITAEPWWLVLLVVSAVLVAACGSGRSAAPSTSASATTTGAPPTTAVPTAPSTTGFSTTASPNLPATTPSTTSGSSTTSQPIRPDPSEGWGRVEADVSAIAGTPVVAGAAHGSTVVLAGCDPVSAAQLPLWVAVDDLDFALADRPSGLPCVRQVEATAFGWYASGTQGGPLWSQDGTSWEVVDLASSLGLEFPGQLGFLQAVFVAPDSERVTLLFSRAAEAESTIATLLTTTDGSTWSEGPEASARLFDSSTIAEVIEGGDGLLAVGSSPGGEFVPTAAVFTSVDGLEWRRVTPEQGDQDYDDKVINDVMRVGDLYIAVGGDFFTTGLMTAWWSSDGISWTRAPHPDETTDPSVAQMTAEAITVADGFVWASGRDFDARRGDPQTVPALWRSRSGQEWERVDLAELEINVPFELTSTPDVRIGVWPPPFSVIDEPLVLFGSD